MLGFGLGLGLAFTFIMPPFGNFTWTFSSPGSTGAAGVASFFAFFLDGARGGRGAERFLLGLGSPSGPVEKAISFNEDCN